jgi:hypothetical protein
MGPSQIRPVLMILYPLNHRGMLIRLLITVCSFKRPNQLRQNECEPGDIVCDNLQANFVGVEQFIRDLDDLGMPVMHVACGNDLIGLVFIDSLRTDCLSEMKTNLESIVRFLRTHQGRLIVGPRRSRIVQTR